MATTLPGQDIDALLSRLDLDPSTLSDGDLEVRTPITGDVIARIPSATAAEADAAIARAVTAFHAWREVPAPRRGELVRLLGEELRASTRTTWAHWSRWRPARSARGPGRGAGDDRHLRLRRRVCRASCTA